MATREGREVVSRLSELAGRLEGTYPQAAERLAEACKPVDEAIRRIGVALNCYHLAENMKSRLGQGFFDASDVEGHPFAFALEEESGGAAEYALCAARGPNRDYGLYVSVCKHVQRDEEYENRNGDVKTKTVVEIVEKSIVSPDSLPLGLRVRILNVLDAFVKAYEEHVREEQKAILDAKDVG